jgi:hypothetical protein
MSAVAAVAFIELASLIVPQPFPEESGAASVNDSATQLGMPGVCASVPRYWL